MFLLSAGSAGPRGGWTKRSGCAGGVSKTTPGRWRTGRFVTGCTERSGRVENRRKLSKELRKYLSCVGKGWRPLLRKTFLRLLDNGWDGHVTQVKEKFGVLRVYIGRGSEELWGILDGAEVASGFLCENCGAVGELRAVEFGWLKTLCPRCPRVEWGDEAPESPVRG